MARWLAGERCHEVPGTMFIPTVMILILNIAFSYVGLQQLGCPSSDPVRIFR